MREWQKEGRRFLFIPFYFFPAQIRDSQRACTTFSHFFKRGNNFFHTSEMWRTFSFVVANECWSRVCALRARIFISINNFSMSLPGTKRTFSNVLSYVQREVQRWHNSRISSSSGVTLLATKNYLPAKLWKAAYWVRTQLFAVVNYSQC